MRKAICIALLVTLALPVLAQSYRGSIRIDDLTGRNRFSWEYDADFQLIFDNRAFDASNSAFIPSGTMNTLVFAPTAGFSIQQSGQVHHRFAAGVELAYDLGSKTWEGLFREPILFYDAHVRTQRGVFEAVAGIFPRRFMEGTFSEALFSGMYRNTDRNIEGALLKWRSDRFYTELAADYMGPDRFQLVSFGRWGATRWLSLGWAGSYYQYASATSRDMVDSHLLNPWLRMDFSARTPWQELSVQLGALASYQHAHRDAAKPYLPLGGELKLTARRWNVGLSNITYVGGDLMPYFFARSAEGGLYATALYFGTPCYNRFYDYVELAWIPQLSHYLSMRVAAKVHFGPSGYLGWQQQFSLRLSLDAFRHRDTALGRCL
jgi:hypothetical protein